jgi:hypothetical protein
MTTAYGTTISVAVRRGDVRSERELPEREVPRHVRFIRVRAGPAVRDRLADLSRGGRRCLRISPAWLGSRPAAERDRGFLILAIADPLDHPDPEATVARYMLGFWAVPARPPLYRHLAGVHDMSPTSIGWQQRERLAEFNAMTSAAEVTSEELAGLLDQVIRTTTAHLRCR